MHSLNCLQVSESALATLQECREKHFQGYTDEGLQRSLKAQVCDVNKALLGVHKLVQAGNRVVFEDSGSYIEDWDTEEKIWLHEKGGMYVLKMWVRGEGF